MVNITSTSSSPTFRSIKSWVKFRISILLLISLAYACAGTWPDADAKAGIVLFAGWAIIKVLATL